MGKAGLVALLLCTLLCRAAGANSSPSIYGSLADGVENLDGTARFSLDSGYFESAFDSTKALWSVAERTSATATFKYEKSSLVEARVDFSPPIHVAMFKSDGG